MSQALLRPATLLAAMLFCLAPPPAGALQSYFINNEVKATNIQMFPKWMGMLAHYDAEAQPLSEVCGETRFNTCKLKEWRDAMASLKGKPLHEQLEAVNRFVNRYPYIEDIVNWGLEDYWATVYEFQRKSGDCEDYAIAKFMSLRALGVPNDDMRIEVVQDLNLGGILHAILIVFDEDGQVYVLDNQIKQVMLAVDIYHYKPIYSINETTWWRHLMIQ